MWREETRKPKFLTRRLHKQFFGASLSVFLLCKWLWSGSARCSDQTSSSPSSLTGVRLPTTLLLRRPLCLAASWARLGRPTILGLESTWWLHRVTKPRMQSSLRILHPPSSDNPTNLAVLILNVDSHKYVFNVPEATSRALVQRGAKGLSKGLQNIFVPRVGIEELGGLPGLIMVLADGHRSNVRIHGPPALTHWLATARSYARRDGIAVSVNEAPMLSSFGPRGRLSSSNSSKTGKEREQEQDTNEERGQEEEDFVIFQDTNISVKALPLLPTGFVLPSGQHLKGSSSPASKKRRVDNDTIIDARSNVAFPPSERAKSFLLQMFPNDHGSRAPPVREAKEGEEEQKKQEAAAAVMELEKDEALKRKLRNRATASKTALDEPPLEPVASSSSSRMNGQAPALTYIVVGNPSRGKFDAPKAANLGVMPGENYGKLGAGKDVEIQRPKAWNQWDDDRRREWLSQSKKQAVGRAKVARLKHKKANKVLNDAVPAAVEGKEELETVTIKSSDVVAPSRPGAVFIQVALPHPDYLDAFFSESMQEQLTAYRQGDHAAHVMVHAVHPSILDSKRYQAFVRSFPHTNHIVTSRPYLADKLSFPSSALANLRMSRLDPQLFRVPGYELEPRLHLTGFDKLSPAGLDTEIPLQPPGPPRPMMGNAPDFDFPVDSSQAEDLAAFRLDNKSTRQLKPELRQAKETAWNHFADLAVEVRRKVETLAKESEEGEGNEGLRFTTLGTGSALPSKYRNVSATLVHLPKGRGYVLLDAGEGTFGQLCRAFGAKVNDVLRDIRVIFLSHVHGDHHMGVTRLLAERKKLDLPAPQRLYVVANNFTRSYLEEVDRIFSLGIVRDDDEFSRTNKDSEGVVFLECEHLDYAVGVSPDPVTNAENAGKDDLEKDEAWQAKLRDDTIQRIQQGKIVLASFKTAAAAGGELSTVELDGWQTKEVERVVSGLVQSRTKERTKVKAHLAGLEQVLDGAKLFTTEVDHRAMHCYGLVVRSEGRESGRPFSFAYSGDTRPCANLVEAGKQVDVLVHEATIEDSQPEMAHTKGHSTFGQAIEVGTKMGAKRVLLTHFSQRYPKLPRLSFAPEEETGEARPVVALAFDLMTISEGQMERMKLFQDALEVLFDADEEVDEAASEVASAADGQRSEQRVERAKGQKAGTNGSAVSHGTHQESEATKAQGNKPDAHSNGANTVGREF